MTRYGIKGNEVEEYKKSVHYAALVEKNDLSAPTCKSCHGAHGATPPGVSSVANVCGTCHVSQRERFDLSPHKDAFAAWSSPPARRATATTRSDTRRTPGSGSPTSRCAAPATRAGDTGAVAAAAISGALARSDGGRERRPRSRRAGQARRAC